MLDTIQKIGPFLCGAALVFYQMWIGTHRRTLLKQDLDIVKGLKEIDSPAVERLHAILDEEVRLLYGRHRRIGLRGTLVPTLLTSIALGIVVFSFLQPGKLLPDAPGARWIGVFVCLVCFAMTADAFYAATKYSNQIAKEVGDDKPWPRRTHPTDPPPRQ